jgi:hypothetical protein
MRTGIVGLLMLFVAGLAIEAQAQDTPRWELDAGYTYVHTDAPPGGCGCLSMNGGNGGVAYHPSDHFDIAGDVAVATAASVLGKSSRAALEQREGDRGTGGPNGDEGRSRA